MVMFYNMVIHLHHHFQNGLVKAGTLSDIKHKVGLTWGNEPQMGLHGLMGRWGDIGRMGRWVDIVKSVKIVSHSL